LSGTPPCEPTSYANVGFTGLPLVAASAIATVVARRRGVDALEAHGRRCGRRCVSGCARPTTGAARAARAALIAVMGCLTPSARGPLHAASLDMSLNGASPRSLPYARYRPSDPRGSTGEPACAPAPWVDVGGRPRSGVMIQPARNVTVPAYRHKHRSRVHACWRRLARGRRSTQGGIARVRPAGWEYACKDGLTHADRSATHTHQPATWPPA
jgi:hypothetical protein